MLPLQIARTIDIAKGAITHLFEELPAVQIGVLGELALAGILLGNDLGQIRLVNLPVLGTIGLSGLDMVSCGMGRLRRAVLLVVGRLRVCRKRLLVSGRLAIQRTCCYGLFWRRLWYGLGNGITLALFFGEVGSACLLA